MKPATSRKVRIVSGTILALGALLAAIMIHAESEPGAIPVALVLLGGIGYAGAWLESRRP